MIVVVVVLLVVVSRNVIYVMGIFFFLRVGIIFLVNFWFIKKVMFGLRVRISVVEYFDYKFKMLDCLMMFDKIC